MRGKTKIGIFFVALLGIVAFYLWQFILENEQTRESVVDVVFFDVGQGDGSLIKMPESNQMIIDGGPSKDFVAKVTREMPLFDRKIEMMVLTHPDNDHITGLFEIFDAFEVERVLMPEIKNKDKYKYLYVNFKRKAKEEKSKIIFAKQGQKISFPGGVYFLIFWPKKSLVDTDTNDFSVVGKLIFGKTSFLFAGDISDKVERILVSERFNIESQILKVSHHGSKYSSSDNFLGKVLPQVAIISVGKNNYGHPTDEVLERLEKYDIKVFRTDQEGNIRIISDGKNLEIKN